MTTNNSHASNVTTPIRRQSSPSARRHWWWGSALLLVGIPWIVWASANPEPEERAQRRQKIQNMSKAERERLQRNLERFQKLSPEKQAELRTIDETVRQDDELKSTLAVYDRWLHSLNPWQRQELRKAESVRERIQVVQSINAERKQQQQKLEQQEKEFEELLKKNLSYPGRKPDWVLLSDRELDGMMAILDQDYGSNVQLRPNSLPGKAAYNLQLLAIALKANIESRGLDSARETPLPEKTIQRMIATLEDPKVKDHMQKIYEDRQSRGFVGHLVWKLQIAWWNEARRQFPDQSELDQIAERLGGRVLADFERLKEEHPGRAYTRIWWIKSTATLDMDRKELDPVLDDLDLKRSNFRPGGSSRSRFGKSGRRGHRDRDRDDRDRYGDDDRDGDRCDDNHCPPRKPEQDRDQQTSPDEPAKAEKMGNSKTANK